MRSTRVGIAAALALAAALLVPPAEAREPFEAAGLSVVASFDRGDDGRANIDTGGTDLAFDGRYVYAAEQGRDGDGGALRIFDTAGGRPRAVGLLRCGGWQNDVAVVRRGLIALGYHAGAGNCGNVAGGVTLVDVSVPSRPRVLGSTTEPVGPSDIPDGLSGVHTLTPYPGTTMLYASPGGRHSLTGSVETVVDVADPRRPRVVARFDTTIGCHDLTLDIRPDRRLGFCSGPGETQVWDVADPLAPRVIARIVNPLHPFQHSSAVSSDGKVLFVGTETLANDCAGGPTGALVVYDISDPTRPLMTGWYGAQRGAVPVYNAATDPMFEQICAPHQFNVIPGTRTVVSGNGSGGVNVVDFSNPSAPKEIAYLTSPEREYFAAYWHAGRIYANAVHSFDVLALTPGRAPTRRRSPAPAPAPLAFERSSDGTTFCAAPAAVAPA